jgi:hypothetical protein
MKIVPESCTIVLLGYWNQYLLTPEWAAKNVFKQKEIKVEFALQLEAPPRYTAGDVRLEPRSNRVTFAAIKHDDETLVRMETMALNLVNILEHTPVKAVGLNFGFEDAIEGDPLINLLNLQDNILINKIGCEIENTSITRKLKIDNNIINFKVEAQGARVHFGFNYHFDVKETKEIPDKISGKVVSKKNDAIKYLKDIYGLELDPE